MHVSQSEIISHRCLLGQKLSDAEDLPVVQSGVFRTWRSIWGNGWGHHCSQDGDAEGELAEGEDDELLFGSGLASWWESLGILQALG